MIGRYLGFLAVRGAVRLALRLLRWVVLVGLMVLAAPVTLVAGYAAALAWLLGWPPRQLYRAAGWCLPMVVAWLAAAAAGGTPWPRVAAQPYLAWLAMWHDVVAGAYLLAAVTIAPAAIPLGLAAGGAGLVVADLLAGDRQRRADPERAGRLRRPAVAAPGAHRPGPDRRPRFRAAPHPARRRGGRGHHPCRAAPGPAGGGAAVSAAALAPGGHRHDRHRQDHPAAAAVGRVHPARAGTARGGRRPAAAGRHRLQGRRRLAADRRPGPPGAPRGGGRGHRHLAGRGQPVAVGPAATPAHQHPGGHDRARHRRGRVLRRRAGGGGPAGGGGAVRAAPFRGRLPGPAGRRLAPDGLRRRPGRRRAGPAPLGGTARHRRRPAVPGAAAPAGRRPGRPRGVR